MKFQYITRDGKILTGPEVLEKVEKNLSQLEGIQKISVPDGYSLVKDVNITKPHHQKNKGEIFRFSSCRGHGNKRKAPPEIQDKVIEVLMKDIPMKSRIKWLKKEGVIISTTHLNKIQKDNNVLFKVGK